MRLLTAFSRTAAVALTAAALAPVALGVPADTAANASLLPPGCRWDTVFTPRAPRTATYGVKLRAVLAVAEAQLGKPYIWGTNPDEGSRGFDCSNFTAYVFRHALGIRFTTSSRGQAANVGWPVAKSGKRPGDLLILSGGAHVGIYVGNDRMIQCGGGLRPARVGTLSVGPFSYWGRRITAVKRLFVGASTVTPANPPPARASANRPPVGWLDSVARGLAMGWAVDPDAPSRVIMVHFYIDGPAGRGGRYVGYRLANWYRPDVNRALGCTGYHGFHFYIPARYRDGRVHSLYVYGIDPAGGVNPLLMGAPRSFVLR